MNSNMNPPSCDCNDYSLLSANTGIANLSVANSNLDGTGTLVDVITAGGDNGTIIKSIIIKAAQPTLTGMVRLFIKNAAGSRTTLFKEIPISTNPNLSSTPTPAPVLPMVEIDLMDGLRLEKDAKLSASTQNAESINVIAEGLDVEYPASVPDTCCNFIQYSTITGNNIASAANTNLDGTGTKVTVFTAPASNGSVIKSITIAALQSTHEGMVRFFIGPAAETRPALMMEIYIPETIQSAYQPSFKQVVPMNLHLEEDYIIHATTSIAQSFAITVEGASWEYPIS